MNEDVKALLNTVGALSELIWAHYQALIKAGFDEDQALYLCGKVIEAMFPKAK